MLSRPFEEPVSIEISDALGKMHRASAVIHQDPQYLHANRITLIGTREHDIGLLGFGRGGLVTWRYHNRADWKLSHDPDYSDIRHGTGILRSTGMTHGVMIADDSIQSYAEIEIVEAISELHSKGIKGPVAQYWFLQRPREEWYIHRRSWRTPEPTKLAGSWTRIAALGLRFRLLRMASHRDDERISQERERIDLPGIEIQPIDAKVDETFFAGTDMLWFSFRVLLAFRFRQFVHTLAEFKSSERKYVQKWHSVRLEPRHRRHSHEHYEPPFRGQVERYLAKGAARLAEMTAQCELMHAAAFGYSSSYTAPVMESAHTACVEGIERLVEAFEQVTGLSRERIDRRRWRTLGKAVRQQARSVETSPEERVAIERTLSEVPKLHLLERVERMVNHLPPKSRKATLELMDGAAAMITARNEIVHGRMIDDYSKLIIERLRAQTLFEALWLGFLGCGDLFDSGYARFTIRNHEHQQSAQLVANSEATQ